jgi:DNA-binding response OmpR family regulator
MRALYVTTHQRTGGWLAEAFAADSASKVVLEEAVGTAAGLARLRDDVFDVVLVSHEPDELDALALIEGYRAGGADDPIIVLGRQGEPEMAALSYEAGADAYLCVHTATIRSLIWVASRAIQRHQLARDSQRLHQTEQARHQREQEEAGRMLRQQWALLADPKATCRRTLGDHDQPAVDRPAPINLPEPLVAHYRELLRTYVIMGSGNLTCELTQLAELLVATGMTSRQTLQLHLDVLEELVHGLGTRSSRHIMARADLLIMELLIHLAEGYRRRCQQRLRPPLQLALPGFE